MNSVVAKLEGASKSFKCGDRTIVALERTDLSISKGELLLILGPSGSGKTTLLSLLGCVIYPTEGRVIIEGKETTGLNDVAMADIRLNHIGFVFQNFNLIAPLNAQENVALPLTLQGKSKKMATEKANHALEMVGMSHRRKSLPKQLSGGEQQRVAIARALVTEPAIMLCDEPTASLDTKSVGIVMTELQKLSQQGRALAVVTHDLRLRDYATRTVYVYNGKLYNEPPPEH